MDPLSAATHKRRTIILGVILTLLIPIVNTFLQKWGLTPLPNFVVSPPTTTQSSATSGAPTEGATTDPFAQRASANALTACLIGGDRECRKHDRMERRQWRQSRRHQTSPGNNPQPHERAPIVAVDIC